MSGAFFFMNLQHFLEMLHHLLPYIDRFNNLRLLTQTNHPREKLRANCYWLRNSKVVCTILSQWGFVSKSIQNCRTTIHLGHREKRIEGYGYFGYS